MKILITENQLSSMYDAYITHSFGNLRKKTKKNDIYWVSKKLGTTPILLRNDCYFIDLSVARDIAAFFQIDSFAAMDKIKTWLNNHMEYKTDCVYGKTENDML